MVAQVDSEYRRFGLGPTVVRLMSYALFEGRPVTTRGRWINPLVFMLANSAARLPQMKKIEKPIFIVGMGRSGTTILGTALSLHKKVGFLNEPKALWFAACGKDDVIGNYSSTTGQYVLGETDASGDVADRFRRIYGAYLRVTRRSRVVDKYPEAIFRIPFVLQCFPDAKFIFLLRNGRDAVASVTRWNEVHGGDVDGHRHDWWGVDNKKWQELVAQVAPTVSEFEGKSDELLAIVEDSDKAAVEWMLTTRYGIAAQQMHADCVKTVRYETLVSSPRQTTGDILDFCELERDDAPMLFAERNLRPNSGRDHSDQLLSPLVRDAFLQANALAGY